MDAILHVIQRADDGLLHLTLSLVAQPPRVFRGSHDGFTPACAVVDQELFMALSDMAFRRYGNCAVYQFELMKLMGAFLAGETLPPMPIALGTSRFCTLKPSRARVALNKLRIFLRRFGLYRSRVHINSAHPRAAEMTG